MKAALPAWTVLPGLPRPDKKTVAPHNYRPLAGRVLVTTPAGAHAFLAEDEYRAYLGGLAAGHPLRERLAPLGLMKDAFDFDAAARSELAGGLLGWPGPTRHVLALEKDGRLMTLETARLAADFAFTSPAPRLELELVVDDPARAWAQVSFLARYARRKSEWLRRGLFLELRARRPPRASDEELLSGHAVAVTLEAELAGKPRSLGARRLRSRLSGAPDGAAWARRLREDGVESVRLAPEREDAPAVARFLAFYEVFLDELLASPGPREELSAALLRGLWRETPGLDVLGELAYSPDGGLYPSEDAIGGEPALRLGELGSVRLPDLARSEAARTLVAAAVPAHQPLCSGCVYAPFCALPPSANLRLQGTLWGLTPESPLCALRMGVLDALFARLAAEEHRPALERWAAES